jgi:hypothetical protein
MTTQMRYCWNCGKEMGVYADRDYDSSDTCGAIECEREARHAAREEREETRRRLEEDLDRQ